MFAIIVSRAIFFFFLKGEEEGVEARWNVLSSLLVIFDGLRVLYSRVNVFRAIYIS